MKKILFIALNLICATAFAQELDTLKVIELDEASVVSFYNNNINAGSKIETEVLIMSNYGQEPSHLFKKMPSIIATSDNGTEFGYGYFRIRGLDQTRINVTVDGCPWNEAEDFGTYFVNSPDLMSSMHSIKVERGASASYNGTAASAGGISLESVDLRKDTTSYAFIGGGSYNSFKTGVVFNSGVNEKGWGMHLRATQSQTDGFRDYGFNNSQALTFKIGKYFNDKHCLDFLSMNGFHRNGQGWIGNTLEELTANPNANGNLKTEDDNWFMSMNRIQYKGWIKDNILLTSSTYFQGQKGSYRMDLDNYMRRMVDESWEATNVLYDYGLSHAMIGVNVASKIFFTRGTLVTGANLYNYSRRHFLGNKGVNVGEEENYDNKGNKVDGTLFVSGVYKIVESLSLGGNVQYRHVDFRYKDKVNPIGKLDSDISKTWNFINYGANIEFQPISAVKLYSRYAKTHREPTRSDMFGGNEYCIGELTTTTPETANDIELGVEGNFNRLTFNVNFFHMWFKNELVLNGEYGLNGLPCHENADKSNRTGIEISADWEILKGFHFINNSSYSRNLVKTQTYGGKTHVLSPSLTIDQDIEYQTEKWTAGVNFNFRNEMFVDMANEHTIPCSYTINLFNNFWCSKKMNIGIKLNNITNHINYCTGSVGVNNQTLYFREAGFNFMTNLKIVF